MENKQISVVVKIKKREQANEYRDDAPLDHTSSIHGSFSFNSFARSREVIRLPMWQMADLCKMSALQIITASRREKTHREI